MYKNNLQITPPQRLVRGFKGILSSAIKCCLTTLCFCIFVSFNFINAETQKERISRMQKSVITKENGDVIIPFDNKTIPDVQFQGISYFQDLFLPLIYNIAPDLDYQKLAKTMEKADFKPWEKMPPYLGKYLKKELQNKIKYVEETKFNPKKIRELINKGTVVIIQYSNFDSSLENTLIKRTKERENLDTKEELEENLKQNTTDLKSQKFKSGYNHPFLLLACNKYTNEFYQKSIGPQPSIWFTEEELLKIPVIIRYYELLP